MKIILILIVVISMTYIGFGISRYYVKRKKIFEDLILLCEKLCVEISFSKNTLSSIISSNVNLFSKDFKNIINTYLNYLKNNNEVLTKDFLFKKNTLLNDDEKELILNFFYNLGRLDASNQISQINDYKNKFIELKQKTNEENSKFGSLSLKLLILMGLLIGIILI